jgi:GNAT superfamily N-acetyltransferase
MDPIDDALRPISRDDVLVAYTLEGASADNSKTRISFQIAAKTGDGTRVMYYLSFHTADRTPLLDKDLECWLCENKPLKGRNVRARVAIRVKIYVNRNFQGRGIATYIVKREEDLFRRWGAVEVQLCAMESGRWVWTRDKFGYSTTDFEFGALQQKYRDWQRSRGVARTEIANAARLSDFPQEFLLSPSPTSLTLYKAL